MTISAEQSAKKRTRAKIYVAGFFALAIVPMSTVAVPLWSLELGAPPFLIGLAVGARALLSVLFSIHGGALMDRLGARRIMIVSALTIVLVGPLYPFMSSIEAVIGLQVILGFSQGLAWMGAQTHISHMTRDDPAIIGRFAFVTTSGNFLGPLVVGLAWDFVGPVGAFSLIGLCGLGIATASFMLPADPPPQKAGGNTLRDLMPRMRDYVEAFRMTMMPAIGFVVLASFLMTTIYGVRHSFYTVYLDSIGLSGTLIGALFAAGSLTASIFGLAVAPSRRFLPANWVLLGAIALSTIAISATPLMTGFDPLLAVALFWGIGGGLAFPLTLYILSRIVSPDQQGIAVGIRTTVNRASGLIIPMIMGAIAQAFDIQTSFLVTGGAVLVGIAILAFWLARSPSLLVRH
ncbi:MAG: MFS transporter [Rhodospirillales bacterium]|nr:MFS transporter [Rhodospirillales bacterium]